MCTGPNTLIMQALSRVQQAIDNKEPFRQK